MAFELVKRRGGEKWTAEVLRAEINYYLNGVGLASITNNEVQQAHDIIGAVVTAEPRQDNLQA